jgi:hypothetical protein
MLLKGCLHTHKTFSCGKTTPRVVFETHQEWGGNFIDFTIHHSRLFNPYGKDLFSGVKTDMTVISGVETTVFKGAIRPNTGFQKRIIISIS